MQQGKPAFFILTLIGMALLAACGAGATPTETGCFDTVDGTVVSVPCPTADGQPTPTPPDGLPPTNTPSNGGNQPPGLQVFLREASPPCSTCHTIDGVAGAAGQIGPNLSNIGSEGADFIRESIVDPNAVIAEECPTGSCQEGVMPQTFGDSLTQEQLDALVEYLSSLQ